MAKRKRRPSDIGALFYKQKGLCHYCHRSMVLGDGGDAQATRDHVVPRAHGGKQSGNLVAACRRCNEAKGAMTAQDFKSTYRPRVGAPK